MKAEQAVANPTGENALPLVVEINGQMAEVIRNLAEWMRWKPEDVAAALCGGMLEAFDGDEMGTIETCFNAWARYCTTGQVPAGWQRYMQEGAIAPLRLAE